MVLPGGMIRQMSEDDWEKIKPGTEIIVEVRGRIAILFGFALSRLSFPFAVYAILSLSAIAIQ